MAFEAMSEMEHGLKYRAWMRDGSVVDHKDLPDPNESILLICARCDGYEAWDTPVFTRGYLHWVGVHPLRAADILWSRSNECVQRSFDQEAKG